MFRNDADTDEIDTSPKICTLLETFVGIGFVVRGVSIAITNVHAAQNLAGRENIEMLGIIYGSMRF